MQPLLTRLALALGALLLPLALLAQQTQTISGTVLDEAGEPLVGVTVLIAGTSTGTVTDIDGEFSLQASPGDLLRFSYIGYEAQEIAATSTSMSVVLGNDGVLLDDVVVIGYGQQRREAVTGAVSSVDAGELTQLTVSNLGESLQGRLAGVNVVNQGSPGVAPVIEIRGIGSITQGTGPLVVVDGVPTFGVNLNSFDSRDVESVTVLKDASASAVYGSRAANGVLLITTKRGKGAEGLRVNLHSTLGFQTQPERFDLLNTEQYIAYADQFLADPLPRDLDAETYPGSGVSFRDTDTDWQDALFRNGLLTQNTLSASGGNGQSSFYASLGYLQQEGVIVGTPFERYNFRINSDHNIGDRFSFGQTLALVYTDRQAEIELGGRRQLLQTVQSIPYQPVFNPTNLGGFSGAAQGQDSADPGNPILAANLLQNDFAEARILGTIYANVELLDGLNLRGMYGVNATSEINDRQTPRYESTLVQPLNEISQTRTQEYDPTLNVQLSYAKIFGDHSIDAVIVAEEQKTNNYGSFITGNLSSNGLRQLQGGQDIVGNTSRSKQVYRSQIGRLAYSYQGKYLASVSGRRDRNSALRLEVNDETFWAGSAGWRISEEAFMANAPFSELKLRGSYGEVGNSYNRLYNFQPLINQGVGPTFGTETQPTIGRITRIANPDLVWEVTTMTNVGLDVGFLNNRLNFSAEYFDRDVDNLILSVDLANSVGMTITDDNIGSLTNSGFEVQGQYFSQPGNPFRWNVRVNVTRFTNEVLGLALEDQVLERNRDVAYTGGFTSSITRAGDPIGSFYGFRTDGLFQSDEEAADSGQPGAAAGDLRFVDLNGDGEINADDREIIGSYLPDFTYGVNFGGSYGNLDFSLFLQGSQGNDLYNGMRALTYQTTRLFNVAEERFTNAWSPTNTGSDIPAIRPTDPNNNLRTSDYYVEDGSYVRLKNLTVGYRFDLPFISDASSVRLYASTQNLFTITDYSGLDPEIGGGVTSRGFDDGDYPQARTFLVGAQLGF